MPSSSLLNLSLELAYNILLLTLEIQRMKQLPCNEKDLALLAVLFSNKVIVINGISALICRKTTSEIVVAKSGLPKLLHSNLLHLLINLENNKTICPLCL
ncbi:unnamed protein product [Spirodela intermedia]|uniref:Uncharacterized protein n=2 Tax=Spirodela intermedia TaxID=51605 RepID=A0A7I8ID04_SPIIN|nr:unnamed protein product [Spirodela intermedia]CAA6654922.1 unnamed protein product [Spirodela intermedia]CAA7389638.1 unnamed protein product [Spirodela intermedia]